MLQSIKARLASIPRWLLVVWGLAGPFLGMFLRELLKDRFYSGINSWIDQTFGSAASTLASAALWLIWMALFGAALLIVWWLTQRQHAVANGHLGRVPSRPDGRYDIAAPPSRLLSPYEVEHKLRVIDSALQILRNDFPPTFEKAHQLANETWGAFKRRDVDQTYLNSLMACRDAAAANARAIEAVRQKNPEYRDISEALQQPPQGSSLEAALGNFLVTYQYLAAHLQDGSPSDAVEYPMEPRKNDLRETLARFQNWRTDAEGRLIELRRNVSP